MRIDYAVTPFDALKGEMGRLVDEFFYPSRASRQSVFKRSSFPAINVWEDNENYYLEAELPGLGIEDVELIVRGKELSIRGKKQRLEKDNVHYHRQERGVGEFSREVEFPSAIDNEKIEANLTNGILNIKLAKSVTAIPRVIKVKSA